MNVKLIGNFVKHLEVELAPGEEFYAEKGALIYIDDQLDMDTEFSGNSITRILGAKLSGESLFIIHFRNRSSRPAKLAVGSHS
ncbi:MAG: AIM24 family protein, partial [Muribaculaceae bacterium]|nr:AIM24 family protein [Muribaculaceae bacterium]